MLSSFTFQGLLCLEGSSLLKMCFLQFVKEIFKKISKYLALDLSQIQG